jgi:hypothetical protein
MSAEGAAVRPAGVGRGLAGVDLPPTEAEAVLDVQSLK